MINGSLEQFLDTGWYSEATLYYNSFVYWHEGYTDFNTHVHTFLVQRWRASLVKNDFDLCRVYHMKNDVVDYKIVFELNGKDMNFIKTQFLQAPIYDGKSFWEVEKDLVWVEDLLPTVITDRSEMYDE